MSPVKRNEKITRENCGTQTRRTFSDVIWDVHLGRFILLSVPISQQLPRLTSLYFFSFLNRSLKLDCTFPWHHSGGSEQLFTPESWKLFFASNKLQCTLYTIFTRVICTLIFVAPIDCPSSPTLAGKNTYYTIFSSRFGYYLKMEAGSCHRLSPICLYSN